jgi:2-amino-4-hydroxy-6-hydroxymethyldihydropteridine diphosphokinase
MIVIAVGANLSADGYATPLATCEAAVERLSGDQLMRVIAVSSWYESEPVPPSDQPWYVNGVVVVASALGPAALLARLHKIETEFGRVRRTRNEARPLDLDLIDYNGAISDGLDGRPVLPHHRASERAFVLLPLADVIPDWRDPVGGAAVAELIDRLPAHEAAIRRIGPS